MTAEELGGCGEGGRCQGERHDWRKAQRGLELVHDLVDLGVHVARELTALIIHAHATLKSCSHQTHVKGMYAAPQPALPTALPPRTPAAASAVRKAETRPFEPMSLSSAEVCTERAWPETHAVAASAPPRPLMPAHAWARGASRRAAIMFPFFSFFRFFQLHSSRHELQLEAAT